jgi:hypothetical protein
MKRYYLLPYVPYNVQSEEVALKADYIQLL